MKSLWITSSAAKIIVINVEVMEVMTEVMTK